MNQLFESHSSFCDLVGETVTIYTQSGGRSGSGFTGVVLAANNCFVRLVSRFGSAPEDVFSSGGCCGRRGGSRFGAVVDIPVEKIVAFVHNAV